jgi:hypothetical protein
VTVQEFEDRRNEWRYQHCQAATLELERNVNNGGVRPVCAACRSRTPLAGVQWLAQRDHKPRRPSGIPTGPEVWDANGNHCAFCGKPRWLCDWLRIGLAAQHVTPYVFGGVAGPLIPFCARCQAMSAAALQETRNVVGEITRLDDVNGDQRTPSVPGRPVPCQL